MDILLSILLGIAIGCVGLLILVPVIAFIVWYANWWMIKIDDIIANKEAREIYKFKKKL